MMNHKMIFFAFMLFGVCGCSFVTEFPGEWLDDTSTSQKYTLSENLSDVDPVGVQLLENENALISLNLLNPLPGAEEDHADMLELLGENIMLTVRNLEGGTSVNLTQGTYSNDEPDSPGEYQLMLNDTRTTLLIIFMNQTVDGKSLNVDGSYEAEISVVNENPYFEIEDFTRDVEIID